jgi:hypothetical protein
VFIYFGGFLGALGVVLGVVVRGLGGVAGVGF